MKALPIISISLGLALLAGCGQKLAWTPLDGSDTDEARLQEAQKTCRIEIKLAGLERAREERDDKLRISSNNQAQMLAKDEYEEVKRQVYREIDTCMNKQGYKR